MEVAEVLILKKKKKKKPSVWAQGLLSSVLTPEYGAHILPYFSLHLQQSHMTLHSNSRPKKK